MSWIITSSNSISKSCITMVSICSFILYIKSIIIIHFLLFGIINSLVSLIFHICDKEYRIDNGTTIPFQVTYSCQVDPFEPSVNVKIEEETDRLGKENRLVLYDEVIDNKYLPDFDSNQIGLQLVLNLDCLLTISLVDYSNGESMVIKKCEM